MAESVFAPVTDPGEPGPSVAEFFGPRQTYSDDDTETIRQYVLETLEEERKARIQHEDAWTDGYDLLMGRHDFTGKADWQSKLVISKAANTINSATAILKAGVTQTKDWFDITVESNDPADKAIVPYFKRLLRSQLEERDPKTHLDFLGKWILGLKCAMATAPLIFKVVPRRITKKIRVFRLTELQEPEDPAQALRYRSLQGRGAPPEMVARELGLELGFESELLDRKETTIASELVDPFDFFPDSSGQGRYEIQEIRGDRAALDELTEASGFIPSALEDVKKKIRGWKASENEDRQRQRVNETAQGQHRRFTWSGCEFWGLVPDRDGETLLRDHVVTIIEDIVVRVSENPFQDGSAFRHATVEPIPFSVHGRGTISTVAGIAKAIIELANAVLDSVKYEVLKAWEIDLDMVAKPEEFKAGITPGKAYTKSNPGGKDRRMIQALDTGHLSSDVLATMLQLDRWYQEGTAVTELTQGLAPMRGTPTATEIADRRQGTSIAFRSIAQWMEGSSLEPCLAAHFNRMLAFRVFGEGGKTWVEKVLGPQDAAKFYNLIADRIRAGQGSFMVGLEFKVTALSNIVARAQELEKLSRLLEAAQKIPGFMNRLNMDVMAKKIIQALGYASEEVLKTEEELKRVRELEEFVLANLAQTAGQQPNSHSGTSQAGAAAIAPAGT